MTATPDRPRAIDPALAPADQMIALRDGLHRAMAAMQDAASDVELTSIARRFVAQARWADIPLETVVATFRDVFAARFHTADRLADRIVSRLRCERFVTYLIAAYRWQG